MAKSIHRDSDRPQIDHGLHERSERLANSVQSAVDAIIVVDDRRQILVFNVAAERMLGCREADVIGTTIERFIPPSLRAVYAERFEQVRHADVDARSLGRRLPTLWCARASGEEFPCEVSMARREVAGRREFTIIVRDITERHQFEEALLRRTQFDAFLFELSRTFIALPEDKVNANMERGLCRVGEFLQIDRVTLLELSHDREQMVVTYSWSRAGVAGPAPVLTKQMQPWWVKQVMRGEVSLASHVDDLPEDAAAEKEYLRQRGVASAASIPLKVGGGIAGAMTFITTEHHISWTEELVNQLRAIGDIFWNALKRAQGMQALLAAQNLLRESEERFRLIASTAPVIIWMMDIEKRVTYVNEAWMRLTGKPAEAAMGTRWDESIHAEDVEQCREIRGRPTRAV
jgi:PAS domain S-box-containing protein